MLHHRDKKAKKMTQLLKAKVTGRIAGSAQASSLQMALEVSYMGIMGGPGRGGGPLNFFGG
jgi:hypothetical protein